jgi:hypothetical protein
MYDKHNWTTSDLLSGALFNHLETQWTEMKTIIDVHVHDDRYFTETISDTTFFSLNFYTGFDADKIDGLHLSDILTTMLPIGAIMIWYNNPDVYPLPTGWFICDGSAHAGYTTPPLQEKFIIGAGGSYNPGDTGGPGTWNGTITATGSVTIGAHQLLTAELPAHTHGYTEYGTTVQQWHGYAYSCYTGVSTQSATINFQTSGDGTHTHAGSTASLSSFDPRPLYGSLYYIMKCR